MNQNHDNWAKSFELISKAGAHNGLRVSKKRVLVGSSEACDVIISSPDVSAIHAVIENLDGVFKLYDMNSTNGTYINGLREVAFNFKIGDTLAFGRQEFHFKEYSKEDLPPVLDMLDPELPPRIQSEKYQALPKFPGGISESNVEINIPRVEYPLAKDPKAEFSEYIFEDIETLYPIFNYKIDQNAIEVIILFKDVIYSIDYLNKSKDIYRLVGSNGRKNDVEFAYLGKEDRINFIEANDNEVIVQPLFGYTAKLWTDEADTVLDNGPINLYDNDILKLEKNDLQIFVRVTTAPPKVKAAPIFRRDKEFKKYLLLMFLLVFSFLTVMTLFEVDPDLEKEKAPERIATILYKKKLTISKKKVVAKTDNKPKKIVQRSIKKVSVKKTKSKVKKHKNKINKKIAASKSGIKLAKTTKIVRKAAPNKGPVDKKIDVVRAKKKSGKSRKSISRKSVKKSNNNRKSKGRVDTYKSLDFKATMSSLLSKGGNTKSFKAATAVSDNSLSAQGSSVGGESSTLKRAKVSTNIGSLSGATSGKIDASRGVKGIVSRKSQYFAGLPYKTVHLGGMDPDMIRRILMENIPQFRSCYQRVLDRSAKSFEGVVKLDFVIGASGHVARAGVETADNKIPSKVKSCVVNVLKGIRFPEPPGGGVVEVSQPMNFYPRR